MTTPAAKCQSLDEIRSNIDEIDRHIIRLLAQRGTYVHEAVRFKRTSADVEAPKRVEQVIAKARALACEHGLEARVAEAVYRAMVGAFIELEHEALNGKSTAV